MLEQRVRERVELRPVLAEQYDDLAMGLLDDPADLVVDELLGLRCNLGDTRQ